MNNPPLVSILIPAYNKPQYIENVLDSALAQTYENTEIIICDDSTNDDIKTAVQPYLKRYSNIIYEKNTVRQDAADNFDKCLKKSSGEYINYLMDDDILHPDKISKMMNYFFTNSDITLVTSVRAVIDETGKVQKPIPATEQLFSTTTMLEGKALARFVLKNLMNVIGEPTTVLFRKKDIIGAFGEYEKRRYYTNIDVSAWLSLLLKGNAVYIADTLSYMRMHQGQNSKRLNTKISGVIEWFYLIITSYENGLIDSDELLRSILRTWLVKNVYITSLVNSELRKGLITDGMRIEELHNCFKKTIGLIKN